MAKFGSSVTPSLVGEGSLIGAQKMKEISYTGANFTFSNPMFKLGADIAGITPFTFDKQNTPDPFTFDSKAGALA